MVSGRYCVVIPAFDAERTIGDAVRRAKEQGLPVVVVNDGSRDQTAAIASQHGALVISHLRNQGKGAALRTGFEYATRMRYDGVVTMDGDGQHDPAEIRQLLEAAEKQQAFVVVGNRMWDGAVMPRARLWTNRIMSRVVSAAAGCPIPDSQCGFRVIRREVLEAVPLDARRFEIETEMLLKTAARRWKIVSVPIKSIYSGHRSHIRPVREGVRFLALVLRHSLQRRGAGRGASAGAARDV